jgi:membrane-bound serine protease (ClpP class)
MTAQLGSTFPIRPLVLSVAAGLGAAAGLHAIAADQPSPTASTPVVYVANVNSIIHPVSAEYIVQTLDLADQAGAAIVVFTLATPGGLVDSTRDIVTRMLAAKTPVAVFVTPPGARAASAGFILTIAADVAAMAPGTHIGAAHPVTGGGEKMDETMSKKATADVAAYVRTLAAGRKRNVALAEAAVNDSRAFTEQEALGASPPLIDLVATDVADLLRRLHGRELRRFDGTTTRLNTAGATLVPFEMSTRQRVLSAIAHPNIAFMLLSLGILGLTVELWSPGAIFPGVVGALSLLLAFFALQLLPVNYAGLLLIALGVLLLTLEIKVTSYGLLTAGGAVSLVFGAMILMDASEPDLRLSLRFVLPVVLAFVGISAFLVRLAVIAQRRQPVGGNSIMIGAVGNAVTPVQPGEHGQVKVRGEIWRATSADPIAPGSRVVVTHLDGLTLTVRQA